VSCINSAWPSITGMHTEHKQKTVSKWFSNAFLTLTLLAGCQEEHLASKNWVIRCWCGYLSGEVQMICIWSSWCHCHPIISCFIKIRISLTFLVPAYPSCSRKEVVKWMFVSISHRSVSVHNDVVECVSRWKCHSWSRGRHLDGRLLPSSVPAYKERWE